jgi:hypothetical protein
MVKELLNRQAYPKRKAITDIENITHVLSCLEFTANENHLECIDYHLNELTNEDTGMEKVLLALKEYIIECIKNGDNKNV